MTVYFFDLQADDLQSIDEEGMELLNADAAHNQALDAFAGAIREIIQQGKSHQPIGVSVRDEIGTVLEISGVIQSRIVRKQ